MGELENHFGDDASVDADTTAAVCGQVAGAFYGQSGIPGHWLKKLVMTEEIRALADRLMSR